MIVGIPFDNAIRSMLHLKRGVTGADEGCLTVLKLLKTDLPSYVLPIKRFNLSIPRQDLDSREFILKQRNATLIAHNCISRFVTTQFRKQQKLICVGGDHSVTYPIVKGISNAMHKGTLGVINIDAHLDMRPLEGSLQIISSGNSFYRIMEDPNIRVHGNNIMAIAIQRNTSRSFLDADKYARKNRVSVIYVDEVRNKFSKVEDFISKYDNIYLSIDMDAFDERFAPGVSCQNENGLDKEEGLRIIKQIVDSGKLISADIVEVSSRQLSWQEIYGTVSAVSDLKKKRKLHTTATFSAEMIKQICNNI